MKSEMRSEITDIFWLICLAEKDRKAELLAAGEAWKAMLSTVVFFGSKMQQINLDRYGHSTWTLLSATTVSHLEEGSVCVCVCVRVRACVRTCVHVCVCVYV